MGIKRPGGLFCQDSEVGNVFLGISIPFNMSPPLSVVFKLECTYAHETIKTLQNTWIG